MDHRVDNDLSKQVTTELRKSDTLSLASDVALLKCMQDLSQKIVSQANQLVRELNTLERDSIAATVTVENCVQNLNLISSKQYMEKRVYDEELKEIKEEATVPVSKIPSDNNDFVPKIKEALSYVLPVLRLPSDKDPTTQNGGNNMRENLTVKNLQEYDSYLARPLPWVVGTNEFLECPAVGLPLSFNNENQKQETALTNEVIQLDSKSVESHSSEDSSVSEDWDEDFPTASQPVVTESVSTASFPNSQPIPEEVVTEATDNGIRPQSNFAVLQKELASRFKAPSMEENQQSTLPPDFDQNSRHDHLRPNVYPVPQMVPPIIQRQDVAPEKSSVASIAEHHQPIQKKKNLFDDSSDSDDDLFRLPPAKPKQFSAPKTFQTISDPFPAPIPNPAHAPVLSATVPVPDLFPNPALSQISAPVAEPSLAPAPVPVPALTVKPVVSSIVASTKTHNGGATNQRRVLFDSSDSDDDDLFASLAPKPIVQNQTNPKPPSVPAIASFLDDDEDDDNDLFSTRPVITKKMPDVTFASNLQVKTESNAVPETPSTKEETDRTVKVNPSTVVSKSQSLFNDDDDGESRIFPVSSTPQKLNESTNKMAETPTQTVEAGQSQANPRVTKVIASLFSDSDSDEDIFKNIVPKSSSTHLLNKTAEVPPSAVPPAPLPAQAWNVDATVRKKPQFSSTAYADDDDFDSPVLETSKPTSVDGKQAENGSVITPSQPASATNSREELDGNKSSIPRPAPPTDLFGDDDSDSDLFSNIVSKSSMAAAQRISPGGETSVEKTVNVGFLKTPDVSEETDLPPPVTETASPSETVSPTSRTSGLIASLKLTLSKQPMGAMGGIPTPTLSPSSPAGVGSSTVNSSVTRKPFAGVSVFGAISPTSPLEPQVAPRRLIPDADQSSSQPENDASLPSLVKDRPRAPSKRRLPSRNHRRSMILENEDTPDAAPVEQNVLEAEEPTINGHALPSSQAEIPVQIAADTLSTVVNPDPVVTANPVTTEGRQQPPKPQTILFNESDDSSGDELFAKLSKPAVIGHLEPKSTKAVSEDVKFPTAPPPAPVMIKPQMNSSSLFGEDSDSDDGLFGGPKVVSAPVVSSGQVPKALPAPSSAGLQVFSDSDEDDLFMSKPKIRPSTDGQKVAATAAVERTTSQAVTSDPLLGYHN